MKSIRLCLAALFLAITTTFAADDIPDIIGKGFDSFQRNGSLAAVNVWLEGSARENDDSMQDEAVARFSRVQSWLGRMTGFELVRSIVLSASTRRIYVAVKFEKGVAWMSFDTYRPNQDWIVTRFAFHTLPDLVLPANILNGQ